MIVSVVQLAVGIVVGGDIGGDCCSSSCYAAIHCDTAVGDLLRLNNDIACKILRRGC